MKITAAVLCFVCVGTGTAAAQTPVPPPPPSADWSRVIGDYLRGDTVLIVTEAGGALKLRTSPFTTHVLTRVAGDTFVAGRRRVILNGAELRAGDRVFVRRDVGGGTFRIAPVRPVEELRAAALAATAPRQPDTLLAANLVELKSLDPTIRYDIRYATTNNFMSAVFYSQPRAFLQRPAAEAVVRAHRRLQELGYGLLIHDAYRPWYVTKMFWDATPDSLHDFVADPRVGSRHNRGAAVDLTLYDLKTGEPIEMPGGYDEFSPRSFPDYPGGTARQRWHRELLRRVMESEGFIVYAFEWWHFDYRDWRRYPVLNLRFEQL